MAAYTSTTPPYADEPIFICNVTDQDGDITSKSMRQTTYLESKAGTTIAIQSMTDADGDALVTAADAGVTPVTGVATVGAPQTVTLDGSGSTGPDLSYLWELDIDGGGYNAVATTAEATYEAAADGVFTFRLTVTDIVEGTDADSTAATFTAT